MTSGPTTDQMIRLHDHMTECFEAGMTREEMIEKAEEVHDDFKMEKELEE